MPRTKEAFRQIRDESKKHILDKAAEVFAKKGLASTKVDDIAEAAGISQGLLYRYFNSKDDVFIELLERGVQGAVQRAQSAIALPKPSWDRLLFLTDQFLRGMREEPLYYQIFSQALALPGKASEIVKELEALIEILRKLIIDGQAEGQITERDPDQLVLLYLSCLYGLAAGAGFDSRALMSHFPDAKDILKIIKP